MLKACAFTFFVSLAHMYSVQDFARMFEEYVVNHPLGSDPKTLYEPSEYIMMRGGKRMRPVLLLSAYQIFGNTPQLALSAALGVEVFHNFTLVHDDIMDSAATRRGRKTVHERFGTNTAILTGDVMLIRSFDLILDSAPDNRIREIIEVMADSAVKVCEGQQLDIDYEHNAEVSTQDYIHMNTLKTAVLLGASLQLGAMIADADLAQAETLYDAGVEIGRAFQIQDDILDSFGSEDVTGKKRGGDILNAKKTILYTTLVESLSPAKRRTFIDLYNSNPGNPEVKIQQVLKWFDDYDIRRSAEDRMKRYYDNGITLLSSIEAPENRKMILLDLVHSLQKRIS